MDVILSDCRDEHQALLACPVIQAMADDVRKSGKPKSEFTFEGSGHPTYEFTMQALHGYRTVCDRNGRQPVHRTIGAPADAILALAYTEPGGGTDG